MGKTKLFDNWTWRRHLPEPFNDPSVIKKRTDAASMYNSTPAKEATLHAPALCGILAYMDLELGTSEQGAAGTQGDDIYVAEYPSHTGLIHAAVFNKITGKFHAGKFTDPDSSPQTYTLKEDGDSGAALFFALMPYAMMDSEFAAEYGKLLNEKQSGYPDMDTACKSAALLCDNLYRRIENADNLGDAGIKTSVPKIGNIQALTPLNMNKGAYAPTTVLAGEFKHLKPGSTAVSHEPAIKHEDFTGKYKLSARSLSAAAQKLVPELPSWYVIPHEAVRICQHAMMTTASTQPMRNFMMRGAAGTGKTESAKAIAAGLGLPYVYITCSANSEILDFLGQILPEMENGYKPDSTAKRDYPTLEDIQMDPSSAYERMTGIYNDSITESQVYDKLIELAESQRKDETDTTAKQGFRYIDTPLIDAIRYGYVCELQEPSIIANPGVLVGLNALLDRCKAITLPTGETVERHPDTVIIVTTNNDYAGCKDVNQSVISRMNLVIDVPDPDVDTMAERAAGITGCTDLSAVRRMAQAVKDMAERCRELMITDGCCGMRELIAWVQSYMICNSELEAAEYTVLSSLSADPENRAEIKNTVLEPVFAA